MNPPSLAQEGVSRLLHRIHKEFYQDRDPPAFHRDRRILLYAITWPAQWLAQRGMHPSPQRYEQIIQERLNQIAAHGDPRRYRAFFPRYLLKSIQDWFRWHGEELYTELKLMRNQMHSIDRLIGLMNAQEPSEQSADSVEALAHAHRILHRQIRRQSSEKHPAQMLLL